MQVLHIVGNVGKDAEVRQTSTGQAIGFSVAVNETYTDHQGERQERTSWYKATLWKKLGASTGVAQYLVKGQSVAITGRPSAEAFTGQDGTARAEMCVRVERLDLVGRAKAKDADAGDNMEPEFSTNESSDDNDLPF